nr:hypothetical protein [Nelson Sobemo-like virus 1]
MSGTHDFTKWFECEFDKITYELNHKASVGYCSLRTMGTTVGEVFGWNGVSNDPDRYQLVRKTVYNRLMRLISQEDIADDIQVFVKQEAHKLSKIEEGRLRLISAVSLVDTLVDRILFSWIGRKAFIAPGKTPCLVGWSPLRGGWKRMLNKYGNKQTLCLDKEAWDWTVPPFLVDCWLQTILELAQDPAEWWVTAVRQRFRMLFEKATFRFSDGTRVQQKTKGVMKSGCYLTILLNSMSQSMLHYYANMRMGKDPDENQPNTIGDDTVQLAFDEYPEYVRILESIGVKIKGAEIKNFVEFAGFAFANNTVWPAYYKKHLFNAAHSENLNEFLEQMQTLYINEPVMWNFFRRVAREINPDLLVPKIISRTIMDYPA